MSLHTVKSSGGDYTSVAAWEAANQADITGLGPAQCEVHDVDDTSQIIIDGWTTTVNDYVHIYAADSGKHNFKSRAQTGTGYRVTYNVAQSLRVSEAYTKIEGLEVNSTASDRIVDVLGVVGVEITDCLIIDTGTASSLYALKFEIFTEATFSNCLVVTKGRGVSARSATSLTWDKSGIYGTNSFGCVSDPESTYTNCWVLGFSTNCFWTGGNPAGNNNASSDGTADDDFTASLINLVVADQFVNPTTDPATFDFSLKVGSALIGSGVAGVDIGMAWPETPVGDTPVFSDSSLQWSVLNSVLSNSELRWSLLNTLSMDSSLQWSILNAITSDADLRWNMSGAITSDVSLEWDLLNTLTADTSLNWDMLNSITDDSTLQWNMLSAVSQDAVLQWNLLNTVNSDSSLYWAILNTVENDADIRWKVLNSIEADSTLAWSLLNSVELDSDLRWSLIQAITNDADLRWDIQSVLGTVVSDVTAQWDIIASTSSDTDLRWNMLNTLSSDSTLLWDTLNTVLMDANIQWNMLNSVESDTDVRWALLNSIISDSELRWSILQEVLLAVTNDSSLTWDILNSVNTDIQVEWDIIASTESDITLQWKVTSDLVSIDLDGIITLTSKKLLKINSLTPTITIQ